MIFNQNLIAFASGAIGLPALLASPAHASGATAFAYSPLFCQTVGGAFWIFPSGQIGNKSGTDKMRVFCPLIHEAKFDQTQKIQIRSMRKSARWRALPRTKPASLNCGSEASRCGVVRQVKNAAYVRVGEHFSMTCGVLQRRYGPPRPCRAQDRARLARRHRELLAMRGWRREAGPQRERRRLLLWW